LVEYRDIRKQDRGSHVSDALKLRFSESCIPHPDKVDYGGEDAYFVSQVNGGAFGVSDGVGGWQESGVNPAEYSKMLMKTAQQFLEGGIEDPGAATVDDGEDGQGVVQMRSSVEALNVAHRLTRKPGSATACILRLDQSLGELEACNLGDSGFIVVRDGEIVLKTEPQQHFFDCPYQLGAAPEYVPETDYASDARRFRTKLQPGDCIVMGTDGLWDNVRVDSILHKVASGVVPDLADSIAKEALENSKDPEFDSPYAVEARKEGLELPFWEKFSKLRFTGEGVEFGKIVGGKMDDITVVVAYVEEE